MALVIVDVETNRYYGGRYYEPDVWFKDIQ